MGSFILILCFNVERGWYFGGAVFFLVRSFPFREAHNEASKSEILSCSSTILNYRRAKYPRNWVYTWRQKLDVLSLIEKTYPRSSPSARSIAELLQQNPLAIVSQNVGPKLRTTPHVKQPPWSSFFFFASLVWFATRCQTSSIKHAWIAAWPILRKVRLWTNCAGAKKTYPLLWRLANQKTLNEISERLPTQAEWPW